MVDFSAWLSGGDVRSDGLSDEVVRFVLDHQGAYPDLINALESDDRVVRGRAADALEKVSREKPNWLIGDLDRLIAIGREDPLVTVRMHLAMILGHLAVERELLAKLFNELQRILREERRAFVLGWAIASMAILAQVEARYREGALSSIAPLARSESISVRTRAETALAVLTGSSRSFPDGWIKSPALQAAVEAIPASDKAPTGHGQE